MDGKEQSRSHPNGGWWNEMKTPSFQVQDYREELHQDYAKQRALKIASSGLCLVSLVLVCLVSLHLVC